jgi:hypothetical protein
MAAVFFVFFIFIFPLQKEIEQYALLMYSGKVDGVLYVFTLLCFFLKKEIEKYALLVSEKFDEVFNVDFDIGKKTEEYALLMSGKVDADGLSLK